MRQNVIIYSHSKGDGGESLNYLAKSENRIVEIPTIKIRPNKTQPRKIFDDEQLRDLANSIAENGILQPLTVRRVSQSEYEIIAGERRLDEIRDKGGVEIYRVSDKLFCNLIPRHPAAEMRGN